MPCLEPAVVLSETQSVRLRRHIAQVGGERPQVFLDGVGRPLAAGVLLMQPPVCLIEGRVAPVDGVQQATDGGRPALSDDDWDQHAHL